MVAITIIRSQYMVSIYGDNIITCNGSKPNLMGYVPVWASLAMKKLIRYHRPIVYSQLA